MDIDELRGSSEYVKCARCGEPVPMLAKYIVKRWVGKQPRFWREYPAQRQMKKHIYDFNCARKEAKRRNISGE